MKSKAIRFILTGLWCLVIFLFSANSADVSSEQSGEITEMVINIFVPDYDELSVSEQDDITDKVTFIVRKGAHFTEYLILGLLVFWCLYGLEKKQIRTACAFMGAALYSVTDEVHQMFSDGRSCEIRDMLIDSGGGLAGALLGLMIFVLYEKKTRGLSDRPL